MKKLLPLLLIANNTFAEIAFDKLSLGVTGIPNPTVDSENWYLNISSPGFSTAGYLTLRVDPGSMSPRIGTASFTYEFYQVYQGTFLDSQYISSTSVFYSNRSGRTTTGPITLNDSQTFYLGFWLDVDFNRTETAGDYYGWAKLQSSSDTLTLLDQATEISLNGITVGAVPEPSTYALMGLGLLVVIGFRFKRPPAAPRNPPRAICL